MSFPRVSWDEHYQYLNQRPPKGWLQGDHVLIVGPTGSGKTTLADKIIQVRLDRDGRVVMPVTKARDATLTRDNKNLKRLHVAREYSPRILDQHPQMMLWPKRTAGMAPEAFLSDQRRQFRAMFSDAQDRGRVTLLIDEMHMMNDPHFIGVGKETALAFHQGRSDQVTMVALTQRPAWLPRIVYPSVSHIYIANTGEIDDLKSLVGLARRDPKQIMEAVRALPSRHDWLYLNPTGDTPPHIVNVRG